MKKGAKVFVGLSGGVDSAVSAALLKDKGYDVTGVFIKVWSPDFLPCTWREERRDAMRVAAALDIPFLFFDFEEDYKRGVADYMIEEYKKGRTPNPDIMCNREVKFGSFWKKAKEMGAEYIATGHYARIEKNSDNKNTGINYLLKEGRDSDKDQSYFLWTLTQADLEHVLFPVGNLEKKEVRVLAETYNIPVAEKKDSQGICFIGEVSMEEFLSHFVATEPGKVLNTKKEIIGTHRGALFYTIGARHGFDVTIKKPEDGAYYVVSKDMKKNTITVSNIEKEIMELSPSQVMVKNENWIGIPHENLFTRIRYRQKKIPVRLSHDGTHLTAIFEKPERGISVGQSIVFYAGDTCVGGGIIEKAK